MKIFLSQVQINDEEIKKTFTNFVASSISGMATPCYFPAHKELYHQTLSLAGVSDEDVKQFVKRTWQGRKEAGFEIFKDAPILLLIFLMHYFLKKNDLVAYKVTMLTYMIRFYSNLMYKSFPRGCNEEVFKYTLNVLTKTHLFFREKSIANAIVYLSNEMIRIWTKDIKRWDLDRISRFIQDSRSRISQSVKSFAETYYRVFEQGVGIKTAKPETHDEETEVSFISTHQETDSLDKLIDPCVKKIIVYRYFDTISFSEAKKLSRIDILPDETLKQLCTTLCNLKYSNNIRLIYKLFLKKIKTTDYICGKLFYSRIKELMNIRRTIEQIYFKKEIITLCQLIIKDMISENKKYKLINKLSTNKQFFIYTFMAYYIMGVFRNTHCS